MDGTARHRPGGRRLPPHPCLPHSHALPQSDLKRFGDGLKGEVWPSEGSLKVTIWAVIVWSNQRIDLTCPRSVVESRHGPRKSSAVRWPQQDVGRQAT